MKNITKLSPDPGPKVYDLVNKSDSGIHIHQRYIKTNHNLQEIYFRALNSSVNSYISPESQQESPVPGFFLRIDNGDYIKEDIKFTLGTNRKYSCVNPIDINLYETHHFEFYEIYKDTITGGFWFEFNWLGNSDISKMEIQDFKNVLDVFLINPNTQKYTQVSTFDVGIPASFMVNGESSFITLRSDMGYPQN